MTADVVTVHVNASIHLAARLMALHELSGLPVVDDGGQVIGIPSEGDLILRQKPRERRPWWHRFFADGDRLAREYQKATSTTAGEVMTPSVISVSPDLSMTSEESNGLRAIMVLLCR